MLVLLVTAAIYALSLKNGFVNLDDPLLITENKHVQEASLSNIAHVFTHFDPELYIPITFLSFQMETWILGPAAWHFHLVSILLHLGAVVFAYLITKRLSGSTNVALLAAALFALHPINAEAVLWVSARKDLLSGFFFLASLWTFLIFRERNDKRWFVGSVILFAFALLSKVSAVSLPLVLVLLTWNHRDRRATMQAIVPYFILAIVFGVIAMLGKTVVEGMWNPATMVLMALRSVLFTLQLLFAPAGFSAVHSLQQANIYSPLLFVSIAVIGLLTWAAAKQSKHFEVAWLGWIFFLLTLAPSFLHYTRGNEDVILGSERYAYIPSLGIFLGTASLWIPAMMSDRVRRSVRYVLLTGTVAVILVLSYLTVLRTFVFEDSIIFNIDILQKHPGDARARYNLGLALEEAKRPMEAEEAYALAIQAKPDFAQAAINLGVLFMKEGRTEEALAMLGSAVSMRPDYFQTHFNLGVAHQQMKQWDEAIAAYGKTVELFPDFPEVHKNLAVVYGEKKMFKEALREYEILAELDPIFRQQYEEIRASMD